jgi:hypothetical protein
MSRGCAGMLGVVPVAVYELLPVSQLFSVCFQSAVYYVKNSYKRGHAIDF